MPVTGANIAYTVGGGLLCYAAIKNFTITSVIHDALGGTVGGTVNPATALNVAPVSSSAVSSSGIVSGSGSANYKTIAEFLVGNGYSRAAAAGIVACIAGESGGNPESEAPGTTYPHGNPADGGGLLGWTPLSTLSTYGGTIGTTASADLDSQLQAILAYNKAQGAGLIAMLNAITNPVQAANFYSQHFERPAVTDSDVVASVANSVYAEIQSSDVPTG